MDNLVFLHIIKTKMMSVGIIHKHLFTAPSIPCISAYSHIKVIFKFHDCPEHMLIKRNIKILTYMPYSLFVWSMIFVYVVHITERQLIFQLFVHMFILHNYLPHRRKYSREYSLMLCVSA